MAKVTKKEMFNMAIAAVKGNENEAALVEFFKHEIELLNSKKSSGKLSKTQEENEEIKATMLKVLETAPEQGMTITEIQNADVSLAGFQNQKLSALMRQLTLGKKVDKIVDKKKSYFKLIEASEATEE